MTEASLENQTGATGFSFLGGFTDDGASRIGRVRIVSGNVALGAGVLNGSVLQPGVQTLRDLVVLDDFIFGNPSAVPETSTLAAALLGSLGLGLYAGLRQRRQASALTAATEL